MRADADASRWALIVIFVAGCVFAPWGRTAAAVSYKAPVVVEFAAVAGASQAEPMRLSAVVKSPVPGMPPATGTVEFFNGDESIGSAQVESEGVATGCHLLVSLPDGFHILRAQYSGDATFAANESSPVVVPVGGGR